MVTQLLALLDGLEARGNVFVIATTNRPGDIDPALRRPGRFDQIILMGPPDHTGRAAIFRHYMRPLKLHPEIRRNTLATELAALTPGFTGADIAHVCHQAALLCVKDASNIDPPPEDLAISEKHFQSAVRDVDGGVHPRNRSTPGESETPGGIPSPEPPRYLMRG